MNNQPGYEQAINNLVYSFLQLSAETIDPVFDDNLWLIEHDNFEEICDVIDQQLSQTDNDRWIQLERIIYVISVTYDVPTDEIYKEVIIRTTPTLSS